MNVQAPIREAEHQRIAADEQRGRRALAIFAAAALLLVIARVLTFPLQRDEQFYVMAGVLVSPDLYDDVGFSHLPNLPLLFGAVFTLFDTDHYLLAARLIIVAGWIAAAGAAWRIGVDVARSTAAAAIILCGLLLNPLLLDQTGMTATNNFLPVPLVLWGLWALVLALSRDERPWLAAVAGLLLAIAAGMKANYALVIAPSGLAILFVPAGLSLQERFRRLVLPFAAGVFLGLMPMLFFFARDPAAFVAHTIAFHRGPQLGYWAHINPALLPTISLRGKLVLATQAWLGGASLVLTAAMIFAALQAGAARLKEGLIATVAMMLCLAAAVSFIPTPAFRQYFTLPIPFALMLFALMIGSVPPLPRAQSQRFLFPIAIALAIAGLPVTLSSLLDVVDPHEWTGLAVHRDAQTIAAQTPANGPVATFGPLHIAEAGRAVYPHLALGPFVYRAMDYVPVADRRHYRYPASPRTINLVLARNPPAAILTGFDPTLDPQLVQFAAAYGYRAVPLMLGRVDDARDAVLYVRQK